MVSDTTRWALPQVKLISAGAEVSRVTRQEPRNGTDGGGEFYRRPVSGVDPNQPSIQKRGFRVSNRDVLKGINGFISDVRCDLVFRIDGFTGELLVKVKDQRSGKVLRHIPAEEVVHFRKRLKEIAAQQEQAGMLN